MTLEKGEYRERKRGEKSNELIDHLCLRKGNKSCFDIIVSIMLRPVIDRLGEICADIAYFRLAQVGRN